MCMRLSAILFVGCLVGSCGSESSSLRVDDAEMDARRDERTRRMALTVVVGDDAEYTATADAFATSLRAQCAGEQPPAWLELENWKEACAYGLRDAIFIEDCVAQHLLEASEAETPTDYSALIYVDAGMVNPTPIYGGWTLPPQLPEARIALAREAALVARNAITAAGDILRYHGGQEATALVARVGACDVPGQTNPTPS